MTAAADRATLLAATLPRESTGAPCTCGGYADAVEITREGDAEYGCGRYRCCCAAFKCRLCGRRLIARLEAPEME